MNSVYKILRVRVETIPFTFTDISRAERHTLPFAGRIKDGTCLSFTSYKPDCEAVREKQIYLPRTADRYV
jgi:hypothetical protein